MPPPGMPPGGMGPGMPGGMPPGAMPPGAPPNPYQAAPPPGFPPPHPGYAPPHNPAFDATSPPPQAYGPPGYGPPPAIHQASTPGFPQVSTTQASPGTANTEPDQAPQAAPRVLAGFLVSYETELGQAWHIYQGANTIGRLEAAEGLDIELDHPTTSSRHAVIHATARPGRLSLEDLGSTNGTFRGDTKLEPHARVDLRDGESIRFGGFAVTVKII